MAQEEKSLLLQDLCARLPYKVKGIITYDKSNTTFTVEGIDNNVLHLSDVEECYVEDEATDNNSFDGIDIKEVLNIVRKNQCFSSGIATSLETIFNNNNINTVGDLMRIGRRDFSRYRHVGKKSVWAIDDALAELGVKGW